MPKKAKRIKTKRQREDTKFVHKTVSVEAVMRRQEIEYGKREDQQSYKAFLFLKQLYEGMGKRKQVPVRKRVRIALWHGLCAMQELSGGGVPLHQITDKDMPAWDKNLGEL